MRLETVVVLTLGCALGASRALADGEPMRARVEGRITLGARERLLTSHRVLGARWSPDGARIGLVGRPIDAAGGHGALEAVLVDVASGATLARWSCRDVRDPLAFSPDGRVVVARDDRVEVHAVGAQAEPLAVVHDVANGVAFLGSRQVLVARGRLVFIHDAGTLVATSKLGPLVAPQGVADVHITSITASLDGQRVGLVVGTSPLDTHRWLEVWSVEPAERVLALGPADQVAFSADARLALGVELRPPHASSLTLLDLAGGGLPERLTFTHGGIASFDGNDVLIVEPERVVRWSFPPPDQHALVHEGQRARFGVYEDCLSAGRAREISGPPLLDPHAVARGGTEVLLEADAGVVRETPYRPGHRPRHRRAVRGAAWTRKGDLITATEEELFLWRRARLGVEPRALGGASRRPIVASDHHLACEGEVLDVDSGRALGRVLRDRFAALPDAPLAATDGSYLYTVDRVGRVVRVFERSGPSRPLADATDRPTLALAAGGGLVLVGGGGAPRPPAARLPADALLGEVAIVGSTTGELRARWTRPAPVTALACASDGAVFVGLADGALDVTPPGGAEPDARAQAHAGPITQLALLRDGLVVASLGLPCGADPFARGALDATPPAPEVVLRDGRDLRVVARIPVDGATAIAASRDGRRLAIGLASGEVVVVDVDVE